VESTGRLPDGLTGALRDGGFLQLMIDAELGGLGLSPYNAFRVLQTGASWSSPVAYSLAITNGFGSGSYLPLLPDGPLKDLISARVRAGVVSGGADAEPIGTANEHRATTAVAVDDGKFYEISGEKVFIGNATVAGLMDVSATVGDEVRLLFVESGSPGFAVLGRHEFMGLKGAEIGRLRLDRVRVPAHALMDESEEGWRMRPGEPAAATDLGQLAALGRILVIGPPSLATARLSLHWSREFARRRVIDGRPLDTYEEIRHRIAQTAADVYTIDSVMLWVLHHPSAPELTAAKNITSLACWRAVDRTVSLLGGEGYETAASKQRRGVPPLPVERFFRDARALRVAGGVDFMIDRWSAETALRNRRPVTARPVPDAAGLSPACRAHLADLHRQAADLAAAGARAVSSQRHTTVLGAIGGELLSMSIVLARADGSGDDPAAQTLADLSCRSSRRRLAALWPQLDEDPAGDVPAWDHLLRDVITDLPPKGTC
jgi:alkylation response protein AidB-like acyl-CoA dehydrogenase